MATFIHITPESTAVAIKRNGIKANRFRKGIDPARGVFSFPVLPDFFLTHQWLRELRRRSREKLCGVYFRVADTERVYAGRFGCSHEEMTAGNAVRNLQAATALGMQVIIPRSISQREILRIKRLPQLVGWRVYPAAKRTQPLWPLSGTFGARKMRDGIEEKKRREEEHYFSRFPSEWYADE